jgi:hypothetical protein
MLPNVAFPLHDPDGSFLPYLEAIELPLKRIFHAAFIGVTPETVRNNPEVVERLGQDRFVRLVPVPSSGVGDQFLYLYRQAASLSHPQQVIHLCFVDRLAFILHSRFAEIFAADLASLEPEDTPMLFCRSAEAWGTHPRNYYEIEHFATRMGIYLFGKALDFTWCHLAIQASLLEWVAPQVKNHDLSVLAEIVLVLRERLKTRDVDWLAWEDPYLLEREAAELKAEREKSPGEVRKRLGYVLPTLEALRKYSGGDA